MSRERLRGAPAEQGAGTILCNACGDPLSQHPVGARCSKLVVPVDARVTVGRPVARGKNPDSYEAERKRKQRAR
jgi:hypothetical protein